MSRKNNFKKIQGWKKCNLTQIYLECKEMEVWGVCPHAHCNTPTHARDSQVHRLTALSKKCFTDGSFPFFFRMTDLSTELRWCPICLCTFKIHTHTHTLAYCLHKETHAQGINSIKCLPFKFHFWSASLPLCDLSSCSSLSLVRLHASDTEQPQTLLRVFIVLSFLPSPRLRWNPSDDVPRCAEPTLPSGADGWATEARQANKRVWHHVHA